jgi:hypothetical protein
MRTRPSLRPQVGRPKKTIVVYIISKFEIRIPPDLNKIGRNKF